MPLHGTELELRVGFDVTAALVGSTGVARYVEHLGAALEERAITLRRYAVGRGRPAPAGASHLRIPLRSVHSLWRLGIGAVDRWWIRDVDVVHATDMLPPPTVRPLVLTIHDLCAVDLPALHPRRAVDIAEQTLEHIARAAAVIVPSEATRSQLIVHGGPAERIVVTPLASHLEGVAGRPATSRTDPYLIHIGALAPRKDLPTLVRALAAARHPSLRLLLVGPTGPDEERTMGAARAVGVRDRIHLLGHVPDAELVRLLQGSVALVFPTLGEGFGFPLLEAMRVGTPVIASDLPVLREVAGSAAAYVAPGDIGGFAAAVDRVAGDPTLASTMRQRGREQAARFSWERTAAATAAVYEHVVG